MAVACGCEVCSVASGANGRTNAPGGPGDAVRRQQLNVHCDRGRQPAIGCASATLRLTARAHMVLPLGCPRRDRMPAASTRSSRTCGPSLRFPHAAGDACEDKAKEYWVGWWVRKMPKARLGTHAWGAGQCSKENAALRLLRRIAARLVTATPSSIRRYPLRSAALHFAVPLQIGSGVSVQLPCMKLGKQGSWQAAKPACTHGAHAALACVAPSAREGGVTNNPCPPRRVRTASRPRTRSVPERGAKAPTTGV